MTTDSRGLQTAVTRDVHRLCATLHRATSGVPDLGEEAAAVFGLSAVDSCA